MTDIKNHYETKHKNIGPTFCRYECGKSHIIKQNVYRHEIKCKLNPKNKKEYPCKCPKVFNDYN